jgi:hypothetical protein
MPLRAAARFATLITLLALLVAGPVGVNALLQRYDDRSSPATGHAQVVAQGVSELPGGEVAWRLVESRAQVVEDAELATRDLGFVIATAGTIVVNRATQQDLPQNQDPSKYTAVGAENQTRIALGEAAFVEAGRTEQRASLSGVPIPYYELSLVPSSRASDPGDGALLYASDAFAAPTGLRDLDLVRDILNVRESTTIDAGEAPTLIHVTAGSVIVQVGADFVALEGGQSMTVAGVAIIQANDLGAEILAAVVGAEAPPMPRFFGTVEVTIRVCPQGVTATKLRNASASGDAAPFQQCTPLEDATDSGLRLSLRGPDSFISSISRARQSETAGDAVYTWYNLKLGEYALPDLGQYPEGGYLSRIVTDGDLGIVEGDTFAITRDDPDVVRVYYLLQEEETGTISITYHVCDVVAIEEFDPYACDPFQYGVTTGISSATMGTLGNSAGVEVSPGVIVWSDLDVADDESPGSGDAGYYLIDFAIDDDPYSADTRVFVDGANFLPTSGVYEVGLTPDDPHRSVDYYLVNAGNPRIGSASITGYVCPSETSSISQCITGPSFAVLDATLVASGGSPLGLGSAGRSGNTYTWSRLPVPMDVRLDGAAVSLPAGYAFVGVYESYSGSSGTSATGSLSAGSPTADFIVLAVAGGSSGSSDSDGDGLTDAQEVDIYGTSPNAFDTDGDGLSDGAEVITYGTDPLAPDTDGDCYSDGLEVGSGANPLSSTSVPAGACDV